MAQDRSPTQWERENPWEASLAREIGRAMTEARKGKMSQEDLANLLGVSRNSIANYEVGRGIPRLGLLIRIAAALDTSPVALLYPGPYMDSVEVIPGAQVTQYDAAQWFSGHVWYSAITDDGHAWDRNTSSLRQFRRLADLELRRSRTRFFHVKAGRPTEDAEAVAQQIAMYDEDIEVLRRELGLDDDA